MKNDISAELNGSRPWKVKSFALNIMFALLLRKCAFFDPCKIILHTYLYAQHRTAAMLVVGGLRLVIYAELRWI